MQTLACLYVNSVSVGTDCETRKETREEELRKWVANSHKHKKRNWRYKGVSGKWGNEGGEKKQKQILFQNAIMNPNTVQAN